MNIDDYLPPDTLRAIAKQHGTPCFVYSRALLQERADALKQFSLPYGLVTRYAMKANNHPEIIELFRDKGLWFDASSSYEAQELLDLGIPGEHISLSSQQPAHNLGDLLARGVTYVATSLHQLEEFIGTDGHPSTVGLRANPGVGTGYNNRLTTGGPNSSFGLWHSYVPDALELASRHGITIDRLHIHVGTGSDPALWGEVVDMALEITEGLPDVVSLDIGGGFKTHYYGDQHEIDMSNVMQVFEEKLNEFAARTGRRLQLEIEPGRWLVVHAGVLLSTVVDMVDTGPDGHTFLRLDTGMNDIARPGMYGAQHQMQILNDTDQTDDYIVTGHNCETGDILTPAPGDPDGIEPRSMKKARIGDTLVIYDAGAYCRSMSHKGYNSYPNAKEIFV